MRDLTAAGYGLLKRVQAANAAGESRIYLGIFDTITVQTLRVDEHVRPCPRCGNPLCGLQITRRGEMAVQIHETILALEGQK